MLIALVVLAAMTAFAVEQRRLEPLGGIRHLNLLRVYLFNPRVRNFVNTLDSYRDTSGGFATLWDTDYGVILSRRLFQPIKRDGVLGYAYKPNLQKIGFRTGAGGLHWIMETEDLPAIRKSLGNLETTLLVSASYDEFGFRRADADVSSDCDVRVLFLGDSFTDGVWVGDHDTFVNRYARQVRERSGIRLCPVNAGVNGYGSPEEADVLEHRFDDAGRPALVFLMYFANDVDGDSLAVVDGTLPDVVRRWQASLDQIARMERFARGHGSTLVLAAIPPFEQAAERRSRVHYQDVLRDFCREHGIAFVDLLDALAAGDPRRAYWSWDPHLTPWGHQVVADALLAGTMPLVAGAARRPH